MASKELEKLMTRVRASKVAKAAVRRRSVKEYPQKMETTTLALSGIGIPSERLRALRQETVDALAESMTRHGLLHPITLRKRPGRGYWIVAGAHRFVAAEKLRWKEIECVILDDCTPDQAELVELDENLIRAELSPAETAMHIGRRKEIYERRHPETKHGGDRKGSSSQIANLKKDRFTADTARKTGKSEAAIQRDATRAKKVEVLPDITNTSLDKGSELDALAKLSGPEQRALAARAKAGEKVSARGPRNPPKPPKIDQNAVKQAGAFHIELTSYTEEFVKRITAWHAATPRSR
ncbi:ParB N-terminal domain-containing protein [Bradyrhizobium sp. 188]|uniref:ParB N-terminal domain-containing protein n=1 Tax=Bradyrhizobium sp. 188 TaxID=2782656 RepID=UPI001FFA6F58|nr:ParB N-terminal domain-containing protein [Bradyrhizobium sp. 188]MCK1497010.1 ParB N-terminal domain-containing protein [Bradyrhizobium sp. 188]